MGKVRRARRAGGWRWVSAAIALAALGCGHPRSESCALGGVCPSGLRCATADGVDMCVLPSCGNARVDPGEGCDDGNNASGDGCPANCASVCGDGRRDADEACDDHNTASGDGCSADCRSAEDCGNHIVDVDEACDDGGRDNHDGCSAACTVEEAAWVALDAAPPARAGHAMAYDAAHGTVVAFGGRGAQGLFDDTWIWDGAIWRRADPAVVPPPREGHAMAYDARRERVVMFGGGDREHSTWEWDGVRWIERQVATAPPSRLIGSAMAYDAARQRVILFGGTLDGADQRATWAWDGEAWREIATAAAPPPRAWHAMAYDRARGAIVVFGGRGNGQRLGDTWELDGTDWTARDAATAPVPRARAAMTFDAAAGEIAMFGGDGDAGLLADTWTWNGARWRSTRGPAPRARAGAAIAHDDVRGHAVLFGGAQLLDAVAAAGLSRETWTWQGSWRERTVYSAYPESREGGGLVYDPVRGRVVLFGGLGTGLTPNRPPGVYRNPTLNDTWEWDGATWRQVATPTAPSPRFGFAMASDGQRIVLFGGLEQVQGIPSTMNDTWALVDAQWVQLATEVAPPPRLDTAMAYDPVRRRMVLFGGSTSPGTLSDTWEWDGARWERRLPRHVPPARLFPAMAFDPIQGRVLMFGGTRSAGGTVVRFDDTWTWDGDDWILQATTSAPVAGSEHAIALDEARGTILVFDGVQPASDAGDGRTWEWDGTDWRPRTPATAPIQRDGVAMAYDARRQRIVMFGDTRIAHGGMVSEWDGTDWRDVVPLSNLPPARSQHAMVYDPGRANVMMFGGGIGGHLYLDPRTMRSDTWTWNGAVWREQHPAVSPSGTLGQAIAFDTLRRRAVMFVGAGGGETWEWDGASWLLRAAGPRPRIGAAMVYDAARNQTLLIGGGGGDYGDRPLVDHWVWDGNAWSVLSATPFALIGATATYDASRERVVLFGGGSHGGLTNAVWEWDGERWADRTPGGPGPIGRMGHTLVYDAARRRAVLFGGRNEVSFVLDDLWEWDGTAWTRIAPASPLPGPRANHAMVYDEARRDLVLFGGTDTATELQDVWLLRHGDPASPDRAAPAWSRMERRP